MSLILLVTTVAEAVRGFGQVALVALGISVFIALWSGVLISQVDRAVEDEHCLTDWLSQTLGTGGPT